MKTILLALTAIFCYSLTGFAQVPPHRTCGTMEYHEFLKQTRKNYETDFNQYNQMIDQYMASSQFAAKANVNITIPVVIHVLYNTAAQNISDAQAISQFSVLDNDFNHLNADTVNIPLPFRSVAGKTGIRFCLAQRDPLGNATTGIIHKSTTTTSFTTDNKVKSSATGGDDAWDVTKYINIWVCNLGSSLLGYGEFPTGTLSNTYGLVINYTATGTMGTATAPFNKGRTGTHEFGHCFNLTHIWGDNGQCGNTDNCTDTPPQKGGTAAPAGCNYGTPTYPWQPNTCTRPDGVGGASVTNTNGDMFMNFMDYTDDGAMNMFSKEQCLRMVAVVNNPPWNVLQSSLGCTPVSALDAGITSILAPVNGSSSCNTSVTPKITLNNAGSTTITSAIINYKMDAMATQTMAYSGSLASAASTVLTLSAYTGLTNAAHTFSVWVTAPNGGTDANAANNSLSSTFTVIAVPAGAALPFTERFDAVTFPPTGWVKTSANVSDATATWTRLANTTGIPVVPTTIACAKMDNYAGATSIVGQLDALRSPALNLTGTNSTLRVVFDRSHRMYSTVDIDSLNIYISTDCGGSWTKLYTKGGAQLATVAGTLTTAYTPTSNAQWARDSVSLSAYVGQPSVYIKFESRSGWGNNLFLDNINVKFTPSSTPPVASFTSAATKCVGSPIAFTDASTNAPTSWAWSFPGSTTPTSTSQNPSVTYTAGGTYTVTLISANSTGTSTPFSSTISVNANPVVAVTSATVCSGTAASITASGASTYSWSTGATTASISVSPTITTTYSVTGTNAAGCVNTNTTTVNVNASPTVSVTNAIICSGNSANLTATGAATYSWNTGATTSTITVSPTVTTNYTVIGTTSGCTNTKTVSVTVNAIPVVSANSATVCSGTAANLTASGATTYSWNTGATTASISVTPTTTTNYTVTGTTAGCSNTKTVNVSVTTPPTANASSSGGITCANPTVTLNGSGVTTYTWSGPGIVSGGNTASPVVNSAGTYTLIGSSAGCSSSPSMVSVIANTATPVVASSNSGAIDCASPTSNVMVTTSTAPVSYNWSGSGIVSGATTATITVNQGGSYNYTVTNTANGCQTTGSQTVMQNTVAPTVSVSSATICAGGSATITASGSAVTYSWNTGATGANLMDNPTVSTSYTVMATGANGCVSNAVGNIIVSSAPAITVNSSTICAGATATLSANGTTTYTWNTGSNASSISVNPTGTMVYTVTGNLSGCAVAASQTATVFVNSLPNVVMNSISGPLCINNAAVALSASPSGGNFSGTGVVGSSFDPAVSGAGTFTVMYNYTDANSCSAVDSKTVSVSLCTGVTELTNMAITVYPNPANNVVYINMNAALINQTTIQMYDAIGKLVISEKVKNTTTTISIMDYASGIYTIRVVSDNNQSIIKLIKE